MKTEPGAGGMGINRRVRHQVPAWRKQPIGEVYRRLVGIHAAIEERTNDDPDVRPFAAREIMEVLRYIEKHGDQEAPT
jgi:hypothetical protein